LCYLIVGPNGIIDRSEIVKIYTTLAEQVMEAFAAINVGKEELLGDWWIG